jgi:hypothetical protein
MLTTKRTKESKELLELRIVHLQIGKTSAYVKGLIISVAVPAGSVDASIAVLRTSPLSMGDSEVGVALI